jgi:hypothetical protein
MMVKVCLTSIFALSLLCLGTGAARAQTPDGFPPARETVCDAETGAAFGLCNAYCEAMDCDSGAPNASATACSKVRSRFQNITGRDMPCEASCPCNIPDFPVFFGVVNGSTSVAQCFTSFPPFGVEDGIIVFGTSSFAGSFLTEAGEWVCGDSSAGSLPITPEQGASCAQLLEQAANRQAVTCGPF